MIYIAFRSKKNQRFFKFEQYHEDGYGKFEASVNIEHGEIPHLIPKKEWDIRVIDHLKWHPETNRNQLTKVIITEFAEHESEEIEIVSVEIKF